MGSSRLARGRYWAAYRPRDHCSLAALRERNHGVVGERDALLIEQTQSGMSGVLQQAIKVFIFTGISQGGGYAQPALLHRSHRRGQRGASAGQSVPMQTIIKTAAVDELLALMPHLIGVDPRESLVLIPFRGKRTAGGMRLDLPASSAAHKRLATYAIGIMSRIEAADALVLVVCSDASPGGSLPQRDLIDIFLRRMRHAGFHVKDALCLSAERYASYFDPHALWHDLDAARTSRVREQLPDNAALHPADVPFVPAAREVIRAVEARVMLHQRSFTALPLPDFIPFMDSALHCTDEELADRAPLLLAILQAPPARDATMMQWAWPDLASFIWAASDPSAPADEESGQVLADLMLGIGPLPDRDRVEHALTLLTHLRAIAVRPLQPPILCMLSWLSWAIGAGSRAGAYLEAVEAIDPEYGMACLLSSIQSSGMVPEWLFASEGPMGAA